MTTLFPELSARAAVLAQALKPIQKYRDAVIVVKYGGNAMTDPSLQLAFAADVVMLQMVGMRPVVVHGGGPQIESALRRMGKEGRFLQGMRVTDAETMEVVQWVLAGQVQQEIVGLVGLAGGRACGLTGRDGGLFSARKLMLEDAQDPSKHQDIGFVGDIVSVDPFVVHQMHAQGIIPVVSPIGVGPANESYNINADVVAGRLSAALGADQLLMLTNTPGVLDAHGQLIAALSTTSIRDMIAEGTLSGGMLPKISGALDATRAGVQRVRIIDGRVPHAVSLAMLSDAPFGTLVHAEVS